MANEHAMRLQHATSTRRRLKPLAGQGNAAIPWTCPRCMSPHPSLPTVCGGGRAASQAGAALRFVAAYLPGQFTPIPKTSHAYCQLTSLPPFQVRDFNNPQTPLYYQILG